MWQYTSAINEYRGIAVHTTFPQEPFYRAPSETLPWCQNTPWFDRALDDVIDAHHALDTRRMRARVLAC